MGVGTAASSLLAARASGAPWRPRWATAAARLVAQCFCPLFDRRHDRRAQLPFSNIMQNKCCAKLLLVESKVVNMQQINGSHLLVHFAGLLISLREVLFGILRFTALMGQGDKLCLAHEQHKHNTHLAVQRLRGGGDDDGLRAQEAAEAVVAPPATIPDGGSGALENPQHLEEVAACGGGGVGEMSEKAAMSDGGSAATARGTNLMPGKPRMCGNCGERFDSGNKLHAHLKDCSASPRQDAVVGHGKRKHEQTQPPASEPETYEGAINAPKRRRFTHHGLAGDVEAVEVGGTFFYNTAPRAHASPHRTWRRPHAPNAAHQASAATGSGHQASATNGSGHHEAPATTGPGHLASATISASTTAPASAASAQAPATSKPPATA